MARPDIPGDGVLLPSNSSAVLHLTLDLVVNGVELLPLPARFGYDTDRPFAVVLDFPGREQYIAPWVISRDLLLDGLERGVGEGDVSVWPFADHERTALRIYLRGRHATALFEAPEPALRQWLEDTLALVPQGREAELISWEAELGLLLD
jgi:hypothetical protein